AGAQMRRMILGLVLAPAVWMPCATHAQGLSKTARDLDRQDKALLSQSSSLVVSPTRVLVRFRDDATLGDKENAKKDVDGVALRKFSLVKGLEVWHANHGATNAISILRKNPHVLYAEYDHVVKTDT